MIRFPTDALGRPLFVAFAVLCCSPGFAEEAGLTYREITHAYNLGYASAIAETCGRIAIPKELLGIKASADAKEWQKVEQEGRTAGSHTLVTASVVGKTAEKQVCDVLRASYAKAWASWK
jgi:hypothetical protein